MIVGHAASATGNQHVTVVGVAGTRHTIVRIKWIRILHHALHFTGSTTTTTARSHTVLRCTGHTECSHCTARCWQPCLLSVRARTHARTHYTLAGQRNAASPPAACCRLRSFSERTRRQVKIRQRFGPPTKAYYSGSDSAGKPRPFCSPDPLLSLLCTRH